MEKQKVQVLIRGIQHDISGEAIEQSYPGYYSFRNNTHLISYEEFYDCGEQAAVKGTSLLKIKDNSVHMSRKGAIATRMEFDTRKKYHTPYQTPYGTFQLEIVTDELTIHREDRDFQIYINYHLNMDGQPFSQCSIEIEVKF